MLFLLLFGAAAATAQTPATPPPPPAAPPDLVVVQKKWQTYTRNPALDADPFDANEEFEDARQAQRINDIRNAIRARGSESREPPPARVSKIDNPDSKRSVTYVYRAKVKNTGAKTIRVIDWGYTFLDPDTQQELGRHLYTTRVKIRPGQDNELVGRSANPQTSTISVKNAGKELSEQVVFFRIEYDDGSVWQPHTQ
ncbi:MAG: hypothetical protein QOH49_2756 [Acidobacteriota bacterium]|nr:hypothetical protein [Acidobacteriota bacterium]